MNMEYGIWDAEMGYVYVVGYRVVTRRDETRSRFSRVRHRLLVLVLDIDEIPSIGPCGLQDKVSIFVR